MVICMEILLAILLENNFLFFISKDFWLGNILIFCEWGIGAVGGAAFSLQSY
jgi:hypothetical protein